MAFHMPEQFRIRPDIVDDPLMGYFYLPIADYGLYAIASASFGWEHVSVTVRDQQRCSTWEEMCYVKGLFWDEEDAVIQIHPKKSENINIHKFCLHLWRPIGGIPARMLPDKSMVY